MDADLTAEQLASAVADDSSFVALVYPFLFDAMRFADRAGACVTAHWDGQRHPLQVWQPAAFSQDDLLAHVASYLNPPPGVEATARLWQMTNDALTSPRGLGASATWTLTCPQGAIPVQILGVRLVLFRTGTGFLTLEVAPRGERSDDPTQANTWLDFLNYVRFADGQRDVGMLARRRVGVDPATRAARRAVLHGRGRRPPRGPPGEPTSFAGRRRLSPRRGNQVLDRPSLARARRAWLIGLGCSFV